MQAGVWKRSLFLLVLGTLLVVRVWLPPTFDGIDPEQFISERHRSRFSDRTRSNPHPTSDSLAKHHEAPVLGSAVELISNHPTN
ncbi:hypothetical protein H6G89_23760 [Oscillatoria sp. FACHB-1407]|uniref:hypothetical protein n=1 Tax=Oscillatoria sp. FACHB-1407 TaxID=2692847 RepID=UPI001682F587|nr:hypothetical protein [Oscillatoria sp. FACHB-1407]MBD2464023.1 hypothetical protein [Oscillatoria sp. FACHB-1407]